MPTQILATGSSATSSGDVVVASGASLTVGLKSLGAGFFSAAVNIELKDDGGAYNVVDFLSFAKPALIISGAGTYRFTRLLGSTCGVFSG